MQLVLDFKDGTDAEAFIRRASQISESTPEQFVEKAVQVYFSLLQEVAKGRVLVVADELTGEPLYKLNVLRIGEPAVQSPPGASPTNELRTPDSRS